MIETSRLATILKLRQKQRDQAALAVSDARNAIERLDEKLREIDQQNRIMDALRKQSSTGTIDLGQILEAQRYQLVLAAQASHIASDRSLLIQELERRQAALLQCQQSVRAIEKLQENQLRADEDAAQRRDQHNLDEWSQTRFVIGRETSS